VVWLEQSTRGAVDDRLHISVEILENVTTLTWLLCFWPNFANRFEPSSIPQALWIITGLRLANFTGGDGW
jgi:hypothetical protein